MPESAAGRLVVREAADVSSRLPGNRPAEIIKIMQSGLVLGRQQGAHEAGDALFDAQPSIRTLSVRTQ